MIQKIVTFALLLSSIIYAGTTGKIAGIVKDISDGSPIPGVNVFVENQSIGGATNAEGYFSIINIPPGRYTLVAQYVGYKLTKVQDVNVFVDKTTTTNIELPESSLESADVVVVTAKRPVIRKDLTSTTYVVSREQIERLPAERLEDILTLEAGVVRDSQGRIHFRGGRAGEVSYLIDGIPVNDAYSQQPILEIEKDVLSQVEIVSGIFNAEYGQALSGVVNAITKDGSEALTVSADAYVGDHVSSHNSTFWNIDDFGLSAIRNVQLNLSSPFTIFEKRVYLTINGRIQKNDGWISGIRRFSPDDSSNFANPADTFIEETGDSAFVAMNPVERNTFSVKAVYKHSPAFKVSYSLFYNDEQKQLYSHLFKLNPDGRLNYLNDGLSHIVKVNHTLSNVLFYELSLARLNQRAQSYTFKSPLDPRYEFSEKLNPKGTSFLTGGTQMEHTDRSTTTNILKADLTNQLNNVHLFKGGIEVKFHNLDFEFFEIQKSVNTDGTNLIPSVDSPFHNTYEHTPTELALYLQDKIEIGDLIVNAGLRYDYFDANADVPLDLRDPNNRIRQISGQHTKKASVKQQLSPRIGLSYPMSTTSILRASYGHFFQIPTFDFLYANPEFEVIPNALSTRTGNADFEPQRTVSYEVGLQQQLADVWHFDLTGFFKDIRNLTGQEIHELYILGDRYARYINRDFGNVQGITFSLSKQHSALWGFEFDYTYQLAKGNASDPDQVFLANQSTPPAQPETQLSPLSWDQRHTINFALILGDLSHWGVNLIGRFGSGMPYTPQQTDQREFLENSASKPATYTFDLRTYYNVELWTAQLQFYVDVFNLFDRKNELSVYSDTGRAGFNLASLSSGGTRFVNSIQDFVLRPDFYSEPRRILMGVRFSFSDN